jgi:hypothetical protein
MKTSPTKIDLARVMSVYSGATGKCHCGCSGKYSYAKAHQALGTKTRGYPMQDDDCSDRSVKLIVGKIEKALAAGVEPVLADSELIAVTVGNRDYTVYFVPEQKAKSARRAS